MRKWDWLIYAGIAVVLLIVPKLSFVTDTNLDLLIALFTVASLASSWNILAGFVGQINLGHGAFFGVGALVTRELWLDGTPLLLALLAGGGAAALVALVVGVPALRLRGIYFAVGTLALGETLRLTVSTTMPRISRLPGPALRAYDYEPRYYLALAVLIVIVASVYVLRRSKLGLGMMAIREDEAAARSVGVNAFLYSLIAFIMSAFFAGLTGGTFGYFHLGYYPSYPFTPMWTFDGLLVTFIGGIGTLGGPLLGAAFFVLVRDVLASNLVNFHLVIFGALFIVIVLLLPGGIIEISERARRILNRDSQKQDLMMGKEKS